MKIVAISNTVIDLEQGCYNTLSMSVRSGHQVCLIAVGREKIWTSKAINSFKELSERIGATEVYFTDKFDYSTVTQDNVKVLRSTIELINPSLLIVPFNHGDDRKIKILSQSSLIASRNIENVLMYKTCKSRNFFPNVYYMIDNKNIKKTGSSVKKGKSVEAFVVHKMIFLNGVGLGDKQSL